MHKILNSAVLSVVLATPVLAQAKPTASATAPIPLTATLPVDSKIKIGTLPNGIRYYIRKNLKPEKRAELRLVVNAGSTLETDDQLGFAHFVEHTAFNGTTHFAKNDLVKYLQSIGVRFGADLNAYTGFDETVYILPIPTDTARIVDQAFTILEDWARGQVFDSAEVVNERGVVREEWRLGKGAGDRMLHQWLPDRAQRLALRRSSADRQRAKHHVGDVGARCGRFIRTGIDPDLQAVVAVGDFDPAQIEAQIKKHFSGIPKPVNPPKRTFPDVPANKDPLIAIASDKEATGSDVEVVYKLPSEKTQTVADYRRDLTQRLYLGMFNGRLDEIAQKPDAPFLGAQGSKGNFIGRNTDGVYARRRREGRRDREGTRGAARRSEACRRIRIPCSRSWTARRRACCAATSEPTPSGTRRRRRRWWANWSTTICTAKRFRESSTSTRSRSSLFRRSRSATSTSWRANGSPMTIG